MADNITLNAGTGGATLATNDVGGIQYQRFKPAFGAAGSATDVSSAAPLPVLGQAAVQTISVTAGSGTRNFGPIDLLGYQSWFGQWTALGSANGSPTLQASNDNTNWINVARYEVWDTGQAYMQSGSQFTNWVSSSYLFTGPVYYRYLRIQTTSTVTGTYTFTAVCNQGPARSIYQPVVGYPGTPPADGWVPGSSQTPVGVTSAEYAYIGGASSQWDRIRVPNVFKTVGVSALGINAVWTPSSGRKFRLMRYKVSLSGDSTVSGGGEPSIQFVDGPSNFMPFVEQPYVPGTAANVFGAWSSGWIDLGNGFLSFVADRVLNVNLGMALTNGVLRVQVCGTEE